MRRTTGGCTSHGTGDSSGKVTVKAEDAELYERNINEGDKVCLDVNNKLEKRMKKLREKVNEVKQIVRDVSFR